MSGATKATGPRNTEPAQVRRTGAAAKEETR